MSEVMLPPPPRVSLLCSVAEAASALASQRCPMAAVEEGSSASSSRLHHGLAGDRERASTGAHRKGRGAVKEEEPRVVGFLLRRELFDERGV